MDNTPDRRMATWNGWPKIGRSYTLYPTLYGNLRRRGNFDDEYILASYDMFIAPCFSLRFCQNCCHPSVPILCASIHSFVSILCVVELETMSSQTGTIATGQTLPTSAYYHHASTGTGELLLIFFNPYILCRHQVPICISHFNLRFLLRINNAIGCQKTY